MLWVETLLAHASCRAGPAPSLGASAALKSTQPDSVHISPKYAAWLCPAQLLLLAAAAWNTILELCSKDSSVLL